MDYSKKLKGECKLIVIKLPFGSLHFDKCGTNYFGNRFFHFQISKIIKLMYEY